MTSTAVLGIDIGGTKTHLIYADRAGNPVADVTVPTTAWNPEDIPVASAWILEQARMHLPADTVLEALCVGGMGFDTAEICAEFAEALEERWPLKATAVNDAGLLLPAAGLETGVAVISGTGAIGLARRADGSYMYAGGWGWVLGDEGGASALVREATIALLKNVDVQGPDDVLAQHLMTAFDVPDTQKLTRAVNDNPTYTNWAPKAYAVFEAAEAGSTIAAAVIAQAGADLAELVQILIDRGADGSHVVAAGSVIVNQPTLFNAFRDAVLADSPESDVRLLTAPPATGAVALALASLN